MRLEILFKIGYVCKIPWGGAGPFLARSLYSPLRLAKIEDGTYAYPFTLSNAQSDGQSTSLRYLSFRQVLDRKHT